jgi:hypothetical protein
LVDAARFALLSLVLMIAAAVTSGCGAGYVLRGQVIESGYSAMHVVGVDEELGAGVEGVRINLYRDPGRLNQELVASGTSRADGTFEIPVAAFGAGWMDEVWMIETQRSGYGNADSIMRLPGVRQRLVITLAPGRAAPWSQDDDVMREFERYR